jgi:hypothetical protein
MTKPKVVTENHRTVKRRTLVSLEIVEEWQPAKGGLWSDPTLIIRSTTWAPEDAAEIYRALHQAMRAFVRPTIRLEPVSANPVVPAAKGRKRK